MARKFATDIDLAGNALLNVALQALAAAPGTPGLYRAYFDTTLNQVGVWNGSTWLYFATGTVADATAIAKGIVQLAGDLAGTGSAAAAPTVGNLHLTGDTAIGHKLTSVTDPGSAQDAATKNYVDTRKLSDFVAPSADLAIGAHKLTGVADPTGAQDAATKAYVDNAIFGLSPKTAVDLATIAALPANGYAAGVLTASGNGALTVDGVAVTVGMRVLVKNEATTLRNGIYTVTAAGAVGAPYVLTRATDSATWAELVGALIPVEATAGSSLGDTVWLSTAAPGGAVGTNAVGYTQLQSATVIAGDGTYTTRSTNVVGLLFAADVAAPANGAVAAITKAATRTVKSALTGDGATTSFTITHNLASYQYGVIGQVNNAGNAGAPIELDWAPGTNNTVVVTFPAAPTAGTTYFVTIIG